MKRVNKILLGLSTCVVTLVPITISLTSCGFTFIKYVGSKKRIVPISGETITVEFNLSTENHQKPLSAKFVYDSDKQDWFKLIGGPYYKGLNNSTLYFSFQRSTSYYGTEFKEIKGHFEFQFYNESKKIVSTITINNFTFNIEK